MNRVKALVLSCALAVIVGGAFLLAQADVFTKLGSNETEARDQVFGAFSGGSVHPSGTAEVFKAAAADARIAMVKAVVGFARAYAGSADFAKRYATYRDEQKPSPPDAAKSGEQIRAEQRKAMEEAVANAQKMAKEMPAMKKEMDEMAREFTAQLAQLGKDKAANAQMDQMMTQMGAAQQTEYKQSLATWEKAYPADPKPMIAARLKAFLDLSATVDFAATTALNKADKKQHFVNTAYEQKDDQWKMLYRAGKPAVDAARALAQDWLKGIGG